MTSCRRRPHLPIQKLRHQPVSRRTRIGIPQPAVIAASPRPKVPPNGGVTVDDAAWFRARMADGSVVTLEASRFAKNNDLRRKRRLEVQSHGSRLPLLLRRSQTFGKLRRRAGMTSPGNRPVLPRRQGPPGPGPHRLGTLPRRKPVRLPQSGERKPRTLPGNHRRPANPAGHRCRRTLRRPKRRLDTGGSGVKQYELIFHCLPLKRTDSNPQK